MNKNNELYIVVLIINTFLGILSFCLNTKTFIYLKNNDKQNELMYHSISNGINNIIKTNKKIDSIENLQKNLIKKFNDEKIKIIMNRNNKKFNDSLLKCLIK
ncbi:MAG: hypothetical protein QXM96_04340 [Candidatus Woesearchaeota archaeon]